MAARVPSRRGKFASWLQQSALAQGIEYLENPDFWVVVGVSLQGLERKASGHV